MNLSESRKRVGRLQRRLAEFRKLPRTSQNRHTLVAVVDFIQSWKRSWGQLDQTLVLLAYEKGLWIDSTNGPESLYTSVLMQLDRRRAVEWRAVLSVILLKRMTVAEVEAAGFQSVARLYKDAKGTLANKRWEVGTNEGREQLKARKNRKNSHKSGQISSN